MHKYTQMKTKLDKQTKLVLAIFAVLVIILYLIVVSKVNKKRSLNGGFKQIAFIDVGNEEIYCSKAIKRNPNICSPSNTILFV